MNPFESRGWCPHDVEWNDERVARFWDQLAYEQGECNLYFADMVGRGVVRLARRFTPLRGRVLDYGCGPGHLAEHLLAAGAQCEGVDFSPDSVAKATARLAGQPRWGGAQVIREARLPHTDGIFDAIFCLETIEHVLAPHLNPMLTELRRLLKLRTGLLFLTTPHDEKLEDSMICCPECGCAFHRFQHVRAFTRKQLTTLMEEHGFRTRMCTATDLSRFQKPLWPGLLDLTPRRAARLAWSAAARVMDFCRLPPQRPGGHWASQFFGQGPHLFWIGSRREQRRVIR
jgi:2-polyprenyl-3-methyl-5-hydroxy-6-metoxy-1,4-benzoquinol methylase